ncbi:MAG: metallophosphoesterase [Bacteroidales bacterium]|nr:metallophosphoesterase [Bacteroidales bacterium]
MKRIAYVICATLCLCACSPKLVIVHLNDTHSHHEAMRTGDLKGHGGIIERGAIVDSIRLANGEDNVLLVHAGDFNQGTSYYSTFGGSLEVGIVNAFGYDCVTLGNHEFDNGIEDLAARLEKLECKVVCANVSFDGTPLVDLVKPYAIVYKAGRKIGIIGMAPQLSKVVMHDTAARVVQLENTETINRWSEFLKKEQKCDIVMVLSHMGTDVDIDIVPSIRNVDIIVGGHSHTFMDGFAWVKDADGRNVPVISDGSWGLEVGEVTVR